VIITNPIDVMTYLATVLSGFPPHRVMGVGTLVDSARFRTLLSQEIHIHPDDLRAYVLGEHGPHQFPVLSHAQAGGEPIRATPAHRQLFRQVIDAGFEVYRLKGYTNYAIATATCLVLESIVFDQCRTMPLSTCFEEWMGIRDNCFSIPVVLGRQGIVRHLQPKLSRAEYGKLQRVAAAVRQTIDAHVAVTEPQ
ncbi:MAG: lactate dehydrogenase, partial [Methylotetracoccus sp.]|nr:lactate dehydrogenase [Methylotetracoccus sp.]